MEKIVKNVFLMCLMILFQTMLTAQVGTGYNYAPSYVTVTGGGSMPSTANGYTCNCDGTGATDVTSCLQTALNTAASQGKPLLIPYTTGYYKISGRLTVNTSVIGTGGMPKIVQTADASILRLESNLSGAWINNLRLTGNYAGSGAPSTEFAHCITIGGVNGVTINGNILELSKGDGITDNAQEDDPNAARNVLITNNSLLNNYRCDISIVNISDRWAIMNNYLTYTTSYVDPIDLEPWRPSSYLSNVEIGYNNIQSPMPVWQDATHFYEAIVAFAGWFDPTPGTNFYVHHNYGDWGAPIVHPSGYQGAASTWQNIVTNNNVEGSTPPGATTDTQAPTAVTNLVSSSITQTSCNLAWTGSTDNIGVAGYEVKNGGTWLANVITTNYSVTSLVCGTTYAITVGAYDAAGNYGTTASTSVTTLACTGGGSTKLTGTVIGTDGTYSGGTGDDKNKVYDGNTATFFDCSTADYAWAGLNLASAKVITSIKFYPRTGWAARMTNGIFEGSNSATFATGNVTIATISTQPTADAWTTITVTNTSAFQYVRYKAPVGGYGNVAEVEFYGTGGTTTDTQAPTQPGNPTASSIVSTSFNLNWDASSDNVAVTGYNIYVISSLVGTSTTNSFTLTGLAPNTGYLVSVKAKDAAGNLSTSSNSITVTTAAGTDTQAPTAPTALVSSAIAETSFTLAWTASTDNVGVTDYEVFRGTTSVGITTSTSISVTGLTCATAYSITVKARDAAGNWSTASSALSVTTSACPSGSTKLTGIVIGTDGTYSGGTGDDKNKVYDGNTATFFDCSTADYAWAGLNLASSKVITSIKFYPRTGWATRMTNGVFEGSNSATFATGNVTLATISTQPTADAWTTITVTNTSAFQYVRYKAPIGGYGNVSEVEFYGTGGTADTQAPSAPISLASASVAQTSFTLSWAASTDNVGVTGYEVFRGTTSVGTTTSPSISVSALTCATAYSMTVKARDAAGNWSAASSALSVTTSACSTLTNMLQNPSFESALTIGWTSDWGNSVQSNAAKNTGTYSLKVGPAQGGRAQVLTSGFSVGSVYTISAYCMLSGAGTGASVGVVCKNSAGTGTGTYSSSDITNTGSFVQKTVTYTVPAGTTSLEVHVWYDGGTPSVYIDDFAMVAGSTAFKSASAAAEISNVQAGEVKIYPNPLTGNSLNISTIGIIGDKEIDIFDMSGRIILSQKLHDADNQIIDLSGLINKGLYIVRISTSIDKYSKIIIVQ